MLLVQQMDQHVPLVPVDITDQQRQHVLYVQVSQIVRNVQIMPINAVNVKQDLIPMEQAVNYAILFTKNVPHVLQQLKHVPHVQQDIMSQEEVVLVVQVKWQTVPNALKMEVNVLNVRMDIIQKEVNATNVQR